MEIKNIFFNRDGNTIGPFTDSDVDSMLDKQQLRPTDMFMREGVHDWIQLGNSELNARLVQPNLDPLGNPVSSEVAQLTPAQQWSQNELGAMNITQNPGTPVAGQNVISNMPQGGSMDRNDLLAELKGLKGGSVDDHLLGMQMGATALKVATTYNNTMPGAIQAGWVHAEEHSDRTDATLDILNNTQRIMNRESNKRLRRQAALEWLIAKKALWRKPMIIWGRGLVALGLLTPIQIIGFGVGFVSIFGLMIILLLNTILLIWFMKAHKVKMAVIVRYPKAADLVPPQMYWRKKTYIPIVSTFAFFFYAIPCVHFIL
jgi:hypothetical protein